MRAAVDCGEAYSSPATRGSKKDSDKAITPALWVGHFSSSVLVKRVLKGCPKTMLHPGFLIIMAHWKE